MKFKLYGLLRPELLEELELLRMAEAMAVTLAGSFSEYSQHKKMGRGLTGQYYLVVNSPIAEEDSCAPMREFLALGGFQWRQRSHAHLATLTEWAGICLYSSDGRWRANWLSESY